MWDKTNQTLCKTFTVPCVCYGLKLPVLCDQEKDIDLLRQKVVEHVSTRKTIHKDPIRRFIITYNKTLDRGFR